MEKHSLLRPIANSSGFLMNYFYPFSGSTPSLPLSYSKSKVAYHMIGMEVIVML